MGVELDRLMKQLGVASATLGSVPADATDATKAAYERYRTDYMNRVSSTPLYLGEQYDTTARGRVVPTIATYSPAQKSALGPKGAGQEALDKQIQDYFKSFPTASITEINDLKSKYGVSDYDIRNAMGAQFRYGQGYSGYGSQAENFARSSAGAGMPALQQQIRDAAATNPTDAQIAAAQERYGISNRDIFGATGNYWGNTLKAPAIAMRPSLAANPTAQNLADYYNAATAAGMSEGEMVSHLRSKGVTDAQMQAGRNLVIQNQTTPATTTPTTSTPTTTTPPVTTTPTTTTTPTAGTIFDRSPQALADYYRTLSAQGVSDADIIERARSQGATDEEMHRAYQLLNPSYDPSPGYAHGGGVHRLFAKYASGGAVKRFARGGLEDDDGSRDYSTELSLGSDAPAIVLPRSVEPAFVPDQSQPPVVAIPAAQSLAPPPPASTPPSQPAMDLMSMVQRYMGQESSSYGPELKAARDRAAQETANFERMLQQIATGERAQPDKAELYFRLAAAFGAPTRTGSFGESLGMASKELAAHRSEERAAQRADDQMRRQLGVEVAKSRMGAAREDVAALRGLAGEEMKDRRALLMEYMKSGRPQSEAGKAAADMGLSPGTKDYNDFVSSYVERKLASGEMFKQAQLAIAQGNLGVAQAGLGIKQEESARKATEAQKLSPPELRLRSETEDALRTAESAARDLRRALEINPNTFDTTIMDATRRTLLEQSGSKDPKIANTREQENLLKSAMISSAAEKMKGVLSDSDIKLLQSVAGLDSKSIEVRRRILENAVKSLENAQQAQKKRLDDIVSGRYRMTTPSDGEQ